MDFNVQSTAGRKRKKKNKRTNKQTKERKKERNKQTNNNNNNSATVAKKSTSIYHTGRKTLDEHQTKRYLLRLGPGLCKGKRTERRKTRPRMEIDLVQVLKREPLTALCFQQKEPKFL